MKVIGLCGRPGSGKSTIADYLTNDNSVWKWKCVNNRMDWIIKLIYGNEISDIDDNFIFLKQEMTYLISEHIDDKIANELNDNGEYMVPELDLRNSPKYWVEMSFAFALKQMSSVIFGFDFEVLLGKSVENRDRRMSEFRTYSKCGRINGRMALTLLGTDILRRHYGPDIFKNILERNIACNFEKNVKIVISDVRFPNEKDVIKKYSGKLYVVYRDISDLILKDEDKKTHISNWLFLTFIGDSDIIINNAGTKKELYLHLKKLLL